MLDANPPTPAGRTLRLAGRALLLWGIPLAIATALLLSLPAAVSSQEPPPVAEGHEPEPPPGGGPPDRLLEAPAASPSRLTTPEGLPPLYQLLFEEASSTATGQHSAALRMRIWAKYMEFSSLQLETLAVLGNRFQERQQALQKTRQEAQAAYDAALEPLLQSLDEALLARPSDEARLNTLARELHGVQLRFRLEERLQSAQIQATRAVMADAEQLLVTLDPVQEEKLVTSLFFLRGELDPFSNPGTYESLIGPAWNMGDFTAMLRQKEPRAEPLDIGGLWGIKTGPDDRFQYINIKRAVILVFVLRQPNLAEALAPLITGGTSTSRP